MRIGIELVHCGCAGSLPDCVEQRPLPPLPEGPKLVPAPHVLLWCVGLHRGSHHHPHVHHHPPGMPHFLVLTACP